MPLEIQILKSHAAQHKWQTACDDDINIVDIIHSETIWKPNQAK